MWLVCGWRYTACVALARGAARHAKVASKKVIYTTYGINCTGILEDNCTGINCTGILNFVLNFAIKKKGTQCFSRPRPKGLGLQPRPAAAGRGLAVGRDFGRNP